MAFFNAEPDFGFDGLAVGEEFPLWLAGAADKIETPLSLVQPTAIETFFKPLVSKRLGQPTVLERRPRLKVSEPFIQPTDITPWNGGGVFFNDKMKEQRTIQPTNISRWAGTGNAAQIVVDKATVQPDDRGTRYVNIGVSALAAASVVNDVIVDLPEAVLTGDSTTPVVYQGSTIDAPLQTAAFTPINNSEGSTVVNDEIKPFFLSKSALIMAGLVGFVLLKNWGG